MDSLPSQVYYYVCDRMCVYNYFISKYRVKKVAWKKINGPGVKTKRVWWLDNKRDNCLINWSYSFK